METETGRGKGKLILLIIGATIGVYIGFKYLLPLFVPFILAYFIARLISPFSDFMQKRLRIPCMISAIFALVVFIGALGSGIFFLGKNLIIQIKNLIQNIPVYQGYFLKGMDAVCGHCDRIFGWAKGEARGVVDSGMEAMLLEVRDNIMPAMTEQTVKAAVILIGIVGGIIIVFVAAVLILKDRADLKRCYEESRLYEDIHRITGRLSETGIAYFKAQIIIMLITAAISTSGLMVLKNRYALVIGIGIAIFDAFPVLGSGLIYIPWSIVLLFSREFFPAAVLLTLYLICQLVRQFMEPKLIGDKVGIKPVFSLMSMYIGVQLFGILGFFLGPLGLIIIMAVVKEEK